MTTCLFASRTPLVLAALATPALAQVDTFPYSEDFEFTPGLFTVEGSNASWEWGIPSFGEISSAGSGLRSWVTNLDGFYNLNENSWLVSPMFDFSSFTSDPTLQFLMTHELDTSDNALMELSINGGPFTRLGMAGDPGSLNWYNDVQNDWWDNNFGETRPWLLSRHELTGAAGQMAQFRWRLNGGQFSANESGVGVDAVQVFESLVDIEAVAIESPFEGAPLTASSPVTVRVSNAGTDDVTAFTLDYSVTGPVNSTGTATFSGVIPELGSTVIAFPTTADLSLPGEYTVEVTVSLVGDEVPTNDVATRLVVKQGVVSTFPYLEDFESGRGGFIGGGTFSTWDHGTPTGTLIDGAASGSSAWVTNLGGMYAQNEMSYLQSPVFDCTALTNDPFLSFSHLYQLDFSDESTCEFSIDGGPFLRLGSSGDPATMNWYDESTFSSPDAWEGTSDFNGVWRTAEHILPGAAGHMVQVRWVLDGGFFADFEDGVGVDDVRVIEAPFGLGQAPQPSLALLDVNSSMDTLGFPPSEAVPGPYFTSVSSSTDPLTLHVEGFPRMPIVLWTGGLEVGARPLPPHGTLDIGADLTEFASGLSPGLFNSFFFTDAQGQFDLSVGVPTALVGSVITFQAAVFHPIDRVFLSNAVQVAFLP